MNIAEVILLILITVQTVCQLANDGLPCRVSGKYALVRCILLVGLLFWAGLFRL
jgi:hypothetical protein